jgi:hypothetical protein
MKGFSLTEKIAFFFSGKISRGETSLERGKGTRGRCRQPFK